MSLNLSLLMKMEAGQAKAELRAVQGELTKTGQGAKTLGASTQSASKGIDAIGDHSGIAAKQLRDLAAGEQQAARAAAPLENGLAKVRTGGLLAGNGVRMLSQQLSQVGQQTMATGQFVNALAIQLPDIGIAFGAAAGAAGLLAGVALPALMTALFGTGEGAKSAAETINDLAASIADLRKSGVNDIDALRVAYGELNAGVLGIEGALRSLDTIKVFQEQTAAVQALKAETEGSWFAVFTDARFTQGGQIAELLDTEWLQRGKLKATDAVNEFRDTLNTLDTAKGPTAQIAVFQALQQQILQATGGIGLMTGSQQSFYQSLVMSEQQLRQFVQVQLESARAAEQAARAAGTDNARMGGPMPVDIKPASIDVSADLATARELLSVMQGQADMNQLIAQHGRESAAVSLAVLEAERAKNVEMVQGLDISEDLKAEMQLAWDAANGIARARISAAIEAAIGPASKLNKILQTAAGWLSSLRSIGSVSAIADFNRDSLAASQTYSGRGGDPRDFIPGGNRAGKPFVYDGPALDQFNNPITTTVSGTSGGAGAARAEKDAVAELIAKLREEQEVLAETDPIKSEMLKYRKQLADATAAERAEVEQLIAVEHQLKAVRELEDFAAQSTLDFLDAIVQKGGSAKDAMRGLLSSLLKVATQALITGQGPLAGILGIKGGLFAGLFGDGVQAKAEGGLITGAGGPRDDKVPLWGSAGEFMMTGRATKRYRPVLERMNAGADIPGFANGGLIGAARGAGSGSFGGARSAPVINVNLHSATGNAEIERMVAQGVQTGLTLHDREVLPGRVKDVMRNQRVSGR